jgi:flagellar protein FliS
MNPFFEQTILNAEPIELSVIIFQHAISCVREAREHLRQKKIAERSAAIGRAYAALGELLGSLSPQAEPTLSNRLGGLYSYMQQRLLDANLQQVDQPLAEVLGLLNTLAEAWSGVAAEMASRRQASQERARPEYRSAEYQGDEYDDTSRLAAMA